MDGHRALKHNKQQDVTGRRFRLLLTTMEEREIAHFIIHARPVGLGAQPTGFLRRLNYAAFEECQFFEGQECHWMHLASIRGGGFPDHRRIFQIYETFKNHANRLSDSYEHFTAILKEHGVRDAAELDLFPELRVTRRAPIFEPIPGDIPQWVVDSMPKRYRELELELESGRLEYEQLRSMAALLWDTGDALEIAVRDVFRALGYSAELEEKGQTFDVAVELEPARRLLLEVTGIVGPLKKDSNKISQAVDTFQHFASPQDRVVLALNAQRERPLAERKNEDLVTREALRILTGLEVPIVTTATLFQIWARGLSDRDGARQSIADLAAEPGGLVLQAAAE
jgi:hypothetical protein